MKKLLLTIILSILYLPVHAVKVSNVHVDLLKGIAQSVDENNDTIRHYMGRVTYHFFAEGNDSNLADFYITPVNTQQPILTYEKTGDLGFIKQSHPGDTLKTAYFKIKMTGSVDGEFVGSVVLNSDKSKINLMADSLVKLMTNEQKQTLTYVSMNDPTFKGFGQDDIKLSNGTTIVGWRCADGPHGIRYPLGAANEYAIYGAGDTVTLFPTEASIGCSWDIDLTYKIGAAIARESRAMGVYCNLGPMCDLVINPRWGRAFETMGEDPYHVAMMSANQIRGIQSEKVIATPKHFGPYLTETERYQVTVVAQARAFRELFCIPFETALLQGGARAIMTCYHRVRVQGFTTENSAELISGADFAGCNRYNINTIIRKEWGFNGIVMTDWDGTASTDSKYSYETEYDMSMPAGKGGFTEAAANIKSKIWSEEPLNNRARRIMAQKLWAWDGKLPASSEELKTHPRSVILSKEHLDLSLEAARKAMTLVKNNPVDGTPVLPLDKSTALKVAVVGPYANLPRPGGGGSSAVTPDRIITPLQGIQELCQGTAITITTDYAGADVAIVVVGTNGETEDKDRETMALPSSPVDQNALVEKVMAQVKKTIVVYTGGSASYAGKWSSAPAILVAFYPGRFQGQAIAEALFGDLNPAGHLNVTFPATVTDLPKYDPVNTVFVAPSVDTAHGYFLFEKKNIRPLFWFGHGLSYTTFKYSNIRVIGGSSISQGDRIEVEVTVTNTGTRAGDDVVQLYVKPKTINSSIARRVKDLRGFARVSLAAQESKTVRFLLGPRDFSIYTPDYTTKTGAWTVLPGEYQIFVGSTADPEVLTSTTNDQSVTTSINVN